MHRKLLTAEYNLIKIIYFDPLPLDHLGKFIVAVACKREDLLK